MSNLPASIPPRNFSIFNFNGNEIRVLRDDNGEPLFVAKDVCDVLDISNVSDAVSRLDEDEKATIALTDSGRPYRILVVNESGLYHLIFTSRKEEAEHFRRWVTAEVLSSIRKTGSYSLREMGPIQQLEAMLTYMKQTEANIQELYVKQGEAAIQLEQVIHRLDNADWYTVRQWCQKQRIKTTASVRSMWGKAAAELSRERGVEICEVTEGPYLVGQYHKTILAAVCVAKPKPGRQMGLLDN